MNNSNDPKTQAYDPGWNDPPKFSYSTQQTTPNRPRNFLNKRVAFPLSNAMPPGQSPASTSLPPMPGANPLPATQILPSMIPSMPTMATISPNDDANSQNAVKEVKEILLKFLESSTELGHKSNDIKRRIDVMEDMWLSGKLNKRIHQQMNDLAYAIREDKPTIADDIHKALMVDHVSLVGVWMPGVKQLIHHCIARSELLSIEKEQPQEEED